MGNYMQSKRGKSEATERDITVATKNRKSIPHSDTLRNLSSHKQNVDVTPQAPTPWDASGGEIDDGPAPCTSLLTTTHPTSQQTLSTINVETQETSLDKIEVGLEEEIAPRINVFAAIDIGTTYSGFAFGMYPEPDKVPDVYVNPNWPSEAGSLMSRKCPTAVLYNPDLEYDSFGFEAENKYAESVVKDTQKGGFLFRRFKMILYETEVAPTKIMIKDVTEEKELPALTVFADSIKFMKEQFLNTLKDRFPKQKEDEVKYVLTVPAIWNDKAKEFMKLAAKQAGIDTERVEVALEPEAASVWCQSSRELKEEERNSVSVVGTTYMVVDLGGGTVDITCHRKRPDGKLEELHRASGNNIGGNVVDTAFFNLLNEIFTKEVMDEILKGHIDDILGLATAFEIKKRTLPLSSEFMTMQVPQSIRCAANAKGMNIESLVASTHNGRIQVMSDKLKIPKDIAESLFSESIQKLGGHLESLFKEPNLKDVKTILLVGGFSESKMIKNDLVDRFPDKCFVIPNEAGMSVLKGGVLFGFNPDIIYSRRSRFAYGREAWPEFDANQHDESRITEVRGKRVCRGVFRELVKLGESIPKGTIKTYKSKPISAASEHAYVNLYCSTNPETKYIEDEGCQPLGKILADLPDTGSMDEKEFEIQFEFGDTTIKVVVHILRTGTKRRTQIQF